MCAISQWIKLILILFAAMVLLLAPAAPTTLATDTVPPVNAKPDESQQKTPPKPIQPVQTDHIDQAGEKVSNSIEQMGNYAENYLGKWINHQTFANISWLKLLFCLLMLMVVMIIERTVRWILQRKINAIPAQEGVISWIRLLLSAIIKPLSLFIWIYGAYAALSPLYSHFQSADGENLVLLVAKRTADIGGTAALFWFLYLLVNLLDARLARWAHSSQNAIDSMLSPLIGKTLRFFIIIIGSMMILQNLTGIKIGPLLASLGIGGLAIALAAKDSIANFFGTLTILFDKPFQVGERVVIDNYDGVVEKVGFRSTRIRTLTGNLVSIPNEKVISSGLENIGRRPHIRWLTNIGITYDTPPEKVQEAVKIIQAVLDNHEGIHPDFPPRVHFNGFNDYSLNIMVLAWYHPPDWWLYQAWLERTCMEILRRFEAAEIEFAFPSQTVYLSADPKRPPAVEMTANFTSNPALKDGLP